MQRMHSLGLKAALISSIHAGLSTSSTAALLRPNDSRDYPDITAFANGYQTYTYNPTTQTGVFQLSNVPFLLTSGQNADGTFNQSNVTPTSDNIQSQTITAV